MFDKLESVVNRYEQVGMELTRPDVASNNEQFRKLMKEHSELTPIVEKYREYTAAVNAEKEALELLDGIPPHERNAEWYFLNGCVLYRRGWFDAAYTSMANACRMDPQNTEYRTALNQIERNRNGYSAYGRPGGHYVSGGCTPCDCCMGLMCADACCNCF